MTLPSFAVAIPVHNKERHAVRALRSVLAQTARAAEIIIVDDASTDGSIAAMQSVAAPRPGVTYLSRAEPGPGGYAARNLAIENTSSDWIAFLDADDSWEVDHLARFGDAIRQAGPDAGCVFAGYTFLEPEHFTMTDWFTRSGRKAGVYRSGDMLDAWIAGGCPLWTGAVAIRRQLLLDLKGFPAGLARRGGDRDLWLRTMIATDCIYTGRITANYHRDADNMLTRAESFSVRQRVQDTVLEQLPRVDSPTADRLRRISNREVFQYALKAWKGGAPITEPMLRDFSIRATPGKYALIQAMKAVPLPFGQDIRGRIRMLRTALRKRRFAGS
ncbi:hypothetical protein BH10PSE15_BH10PSE15_09320 [soil metagenome]